MQDLRITLIQTDILWEDVPANLDRFGHLIERIKEPTDLILLPETFNTGFSIDPVHFAEDMHGKSMQFLKRMAQVHKTAIMATLLIREGNDFYNRLVCFFPDGRFETCDKRHLFRLSDEFRLLKPGQTRPVIRVKGWKIFPMICYDLRFPVWSRNSWSKGEYGYDLIVCLANWPASRSSVWKTLLTARAIENQSYIAGVNRIGRDGHGTAHTGDSMVADAKGNLLYIAGESTEEVRTVTLSASELTSFRSSFTVGMDWDPFNLIMKKQP
jgi:predicted amidohydrolase